MDILFDDVFVGLEKCEDEQEREGNIKEWMNRHWATMVHYFVNRKTC